MVLSLRLAFADLPWGHVVSQLPREFVLSIGAGQVLLPSLVVGAFYGLYRILRSDRSATPVIRRWRDGWGRRPAVARRYVWTSVAMFAPTAGVVFLRWLDTGYDPQLGRLAIGYGALLILAIAVHEARAVAAWHFRQPRQWNSHKAAAAMAGIYVAAAIPSMVAAAAGIGLSEAKVCATDGFEEVGFLVGETQDRVYLGEKRHFNRRLAVLPLTKVGETFIGPEAGDATCEFGPAPSSSSKRQDSAHRHQGRASTPSGGVQSHSWFIEPRGNNP